MKIIHMAKAVKQFGGITAICFKRPRAISLSKASWTFRWEAVTCEECKKLLSELNF